MTDAEIDAFLDEPKPDGTFRERRAGGLFTRTVKRLGQYEEMYWSRYDFSVDQWEAMTWYEPVLASAQSGDIYVQCKYYNGGDDPLPFGVGGVSQTGPLQFPCKEFANAIDAMEYYWEVAKPVTDRMDVIRNHEGHGSLKEGAL